MKILITGATGFVGKTLVPYLYKLECGNLTLLVRNVKKATMLFDSCGGINMINTENEDWPAQVIKLNPDIVLHLATYFTTKHDVDNVKELISSNILFPTLLLEALTKTQCRCFINIGTFTEYLFGFGEFSPNNLYSSLKSAFRPIIQYYQKISCWKWVNVILYSPYGRRNNSKKVLDLMIDSLYSEKTINFTLGEQILDFIHVDDIADFFYKLILKEGLLPDSYYQFHLGTGLGMTLRELGENVEKVFGRKMNCCWGGIPYQPLEAKAAVAPIMNNIVLLDWKAKIGIKEGLKILKEDLYTISNHGL